MGIWSPGPTRPPRQASLDTSVSGREDGVNTPPGRLENDVVLPRISLTCMFTFTAAELCTNQTVKDLVITAACRACTNAGCHSRKLPELACTEAELSA